MDPVLCEFTKALVVCQLDFDFRYELWTDKLGGAFPEMDVAELVVRAVLARVG